MSITIYPSVVLDDVIAQPSDQINGRRLLVNFDSINIYTNDDGYFTDSGLITLVPVIVRIEGTTLESPIFEDFSFDVSGQDIVGSLHFTTFTDISIIQGNKIFTNDGYGAVEVKEYLPLSQFDGYEGEFLKTSAYGSGIFVITDAYGNNYDPGHGQYHFKYAAPLKLNMKIAPKTIYVGNNEKLTNAADGIMDEVKITSATATKTRTRVLSGSYDISTEVFRAAENEPDAKTLVLLHLDNNQQEVVDGLYEPLESLMLDDSTLQTIAGLRNDRINFINYVNSLNIKGTIVDESLDTRPFSEQLYDLVSVLNTIENSARYYKVAGNFFPSEFSVNENFETAGVFSGDDYYIENVGLINNDHGSIELWLAPLSNVLADFSRKIYLDAVNHAKVGQDGNLSSINANLIKLPNNIKAKYINSIKVLNAELDFDFAPFSTLSNDGNIITLSRELPANNIEIIVDYIPYDTPNDRLTLYKDEKGNLIFSLLADGTLFQLISDIDEWKKNEWHRVMLTWNANSKNSTDRMNMYVDGIPTNILKYGDGYAFNTFNFRQETQINTNIQAFPKNIIFHGELNRLNIGTNFLGTLPGMCRMANLRISSIERQPIIDARGNKVDIGFGGGNQAAMPQMRDNSTIYLENFDPNNGFVNNFATIQNPAAGAHDLHIIVRDFFKLVRGVNNGRVERLLRELLRVMRPAEARTRITITTEN